MKVVIMTIIVTILIFIISALPLHLAVKIMGGRTYLLKSILVTFISGIVTAIIGTFFPFGTIIALILLIWIYREMFRLKWLKAFIVWLLQILIIFFLIMLIGILGFSFITLSLIF